MGNIYILMNKPQGCVTARTDLNHKTVMDYLPVCVRETLHPVGRLDKDTEGLLLITNDGKWNQYLMSPQHRIKKEYFFIVLGTITPGWHKNLEQGIVLIGETVKTDPAQISVQEVTTLEKLSESYKEKLEPKTLKNRPSSLVTLGSITISQGKKHQIKRMMKAAGCYVIYLRRDAVGGIRLEENLQPGSFRKLTEEELMEL